MTIEHDHDNETSDDNDNDLSVSTPSAARLAFIAAHAGEASDGDDDDAEGDDAEAAPAEAPQGEPSRVERLRAELEKRREAESQRRLAAEEQEYRRQQLQMQQRQQATRVRTDRDFLAELAVDPVEALRRSGVSPEKTLEALTKDALNPGSVRTEEQVRQLQGAITALQDEIKNRDRREAHLRHQGEVLAERRAIADALGDAKEYPHAAKISDVERVKYALAEWEDYEAEEQSAGRVAIYDREFIAARTEETLEKLAAKLSGSTAAPKKTTKPAVTPKPTPGATRASKPTGKTTETLTPALAAETTAPRGPIPLSKRREAFIKRVTSHS